MLLLQWAKLKVNDDIINIMHVLMNVYESTSTQAEFIVPTKYNNQNINNCNKTHQCILQRGDVSN